MQIVNHFLEYLFVSALSAFNRRSFKTLLIIPASPGAILVPSRSPTRHSAGFRYSVDEGVTGRSFAVINGVKDIVGELI